MKGTEQVSNATEMHRVIVVHGAVVSSSPQCKVNIDGVPGCNSSYRAILHQHQKYDLFCRSLNNWNAVSPTFVFKFLGVLNVCVI